MAEEGPQGAPQLLILVAAILFVAGDTLILALWAGGVIRRRPVLAPKWSVAHVFLAFQGVVVLMMLAWFVIALILTWLAPNSFQPYAGGTTSPADLYGLLLPGLTVQVAAMMALPVVLVVRFYRAPIAALGIRVASLRSAVAHLVLGVGLAVILVPIWELAEHGWTWVVLESGAIPFPRFMQDLSKATDPTTVLDSARSQPLAMGWLLVDIILLGPVAEEVFFRGLAHTVLRRRFRLIAGTLLSALVFAAIHGNPLAFGPIWLIGILLAVLYDRTASLVAPAAFHCTNNGAAMLLYFLAPKFSFWEWLLPGTR